MTERQYGHREQSVGRTRSHYTVLELGIVKCGGLHEKEEQAEAKKQTLAEQSTAQVIFLSRGDVYICDNRIHTHGFNDGTHSSVKI